MLVSLGRALSYLYPDREGDFEAKAGENGEEVIVRWDLDVPEPTPQEIEAAKLDYGRSRKEEEIIAAATQSLAQQFPNGVTEFQFVLCAQVVGYLQAESVPVDSRLVAAKEAGERAETLREEIATASLEGLDNISW